MISYKNPETAPPIMQGSPPPPEMRLPMIDWDRPSWNRWAFQRVREFLPTAPILRGDVVSELRVAEGDIETLSFETHTGDTKTITKIMDDTYTDGMLIWLDGKIIHESYHNGMECRSLHLAQSVSKSITATAGASLIAEGLIDPHAPVTDTLPELAATAWNGATLQHVMDMASGVRYNETNDQRDSDVGKTDYACGWKPAPKGEDVSDWPTRI